MEEKWKSKEEERMEKREPEKQGVVRIAMGTAHMKIVMKMVTFFRFTFGMVLVRVTLFHIH
ncbi:hypothetical protein [Zhaonella formicivorans]|uniref:hypothetical protein n=1 Tax=Zhaonella formicivorans TaxID=2528593 RepID=UPI0010E522C5|nr:hypothetical protein [Zhaonella formicivorans]